MKIKITDLRKLMHKSLTAKYFSNSQARDITDVLLYAEMVGKNTQGIIKFLGNEPIQNIKPLYKPKLLKQTKVSAFIDGGQNPGMLVTRIATKMAIKKCKKYGIAVIATNNSYASTGALGFYANEIAQNDFIGIVMSGTPKGVAPYGSIDKLIGINPIAFAVPTEDDPLIFDTATSAITWYGLVRAKIMRENIPQNAAVDSEGNVTTDPEKAMQGAVLTFGDNRKMSGLSMMIEMLTGSLVGATSADKDGKWYNGNFILAIDPDLFIGRAQLKKNSTILLEKIKKSRPGKNFDEVIIPGEKMLKAKKKAEESGILEIEDKVYIDFLNETKT